MIWEVAVAKKLHERRKIVRRFRKRLENSPCLTDGLFVVSNFLWGIDCEDPSPHLEFRLREIFAEARETRQLAMARSLDKASERWKAETFRCAFCKQSPDGTYYLVNPPDGYGMPKMWACWDCLKSAEPGSLLAKKRELYPDDFTEDFIDSWFGEVTAKAAHK